MRFLLMIFIIGIGYITSSYGIIVAAKKQKVATASFEKKVIQAENIHFCAGVTSKNLQKMGCLQVTEQEKLITNYFQIIKADVAHKLLGLDKKPWSKPKLGPVKIGVVDSAFDYSAASIQKALTQETLNNQPSLTKSNFINANGHGNSVVSIIHRIAPMAKINYYPIDRSGVGNSVDQINARNIEDAAKTSDFINISIKFSNTGKIDPYILTAIETAIQNEVGVVIALGNDSMSRPEDQDYIQTLINLANNAKGKILLVAGSEYDLSNTELLWADEPSVDPNTGIKYPSGTNYPLLSFGKVTKYILTAPSNGLYVRGPLDLPFVRSGTSFAAPMVTAAAALLKSYRPDASPGRIFDALRQGARLYNLQGEKLGIEFGSGILDIAGSMRVLDKVLGIPTTTSMKDLD